MAGVPPAVTTGRCGLAAARTVRKLYATFFEARSEPARELDELMGATRFGMGQRQPDDLVEHPVHDEDVWSNPFLKGLRDRARGHMADQGDGNHFAFLGEIEIGGEMTGCLRMAGHVELAAQVIGEIRPLGCIMAGDAGPAPWKRRQEELSPKQIRQMAHRAERRTSKQRGWEEDS